MYLHTVEGADFVIDGPLYFVFETGTDNTSCISVNITSDENYEGDHSFTIRLSDAPPGPMGKRSVNHFSEPKGPIIGSVDSSTVFINDPEGNAFANSSYV